MPIVANKTKVCPPHYWVLDGANRGVCKKCNATRQFPTPIEGSWEYGRKYEREKPQEREKVKRKEEGIMKRLSKSAIEYLDYQWGVFSGCENHLTGVCGGGGKDFNCWAKNISQHFHALYPDGFKPHYYPEAIDSPKHLKKASIIGVGWVGDVIGYGLEFREPIFDTIGQCPQHKFLFLTKNPALLVVWEPFPPNAWVGVSCTTFQQWQVASGFLTDVEATVKYVSFEPLLEYIGIYPQRLQYVGINWIILGARTQPYLCPSPDSVAEIVTAAKRAGIPLFLKNNLMKGLGVGALLQEKPMLGYPKQEVRDVP